MLQPLFALLPGSFQGEGFILEPFFVPKNDIQTANVRFLDVSDAIDVGLRRALVRNFGRAVLVSITPAVHPCFHLQLYRLLVGLWILEIGRVLDAFSFLSCPSLCNFRATG